MLIKELLSGQKNITEADEKIFEQIKVNWDRVAKPLDSLGKFENVIAKIGAAAGTVNPKINKKAIVMMISDNGIVARAVSQCGQEVTLAVARAMGRRESSVGKMSSVYGIDTIPIDIGINTDEVIEGVRNCKIRPGTRDFLSEPAMTAEETLEAIEVGIDIVRQCREEGYNLLGLGEMGIGNTTTSSAIAAILLDMDAETVTGKGAGLSNKGLIRKVNVVSQAKSKYESLCKDPLAVLSAVGGYDIAGLVGMAIGGAYYRMPIILDGVISAVAALVATRIFPQTRGYLIASHISREPVAAKILDEISLLPVIDADMALGEGTGAVMMMSLIDLAMSLYEDCTSFADMNIDAYVRQ